ncbi:hypothetical protein niasHT_025979 [Heterodera trifolii]|uniref:Uncharacterized protein n=1 Tax=Heterodera trifolii TaxID=157864 RepID=A0ABD2JAE7_9BILA
MHGGGAACDVRTTALTGEVVPRLRRRIGSGGAACDVRTTALPTSSVIGRYGGAALTNVPCLAWAPMHWRRRRVRRADDGTADKQSDRRYVTHPSQMMGFQIVKPQRREMMHYLQQKFEQEFKQRHGRFLFVQEFRQSEDKTVPALLFIAFRIDRETFCVQIAAGEGKVFYCPMEYKQQDEKMATLCLKILSERAELMGRDYTLAHPLLKSCDNELQAYRCVPQPGFEKSLKFHLSWVVLCLENGLHYFKTQEHERKKAEEDKNAKQRQWPNLLAFTDECQHEMMTHRQMMVQELRMSPEIVMDRAQEIDKYCSPQGDIESEGKTVHCLMAHAQERDEKKVLTQQCKNALQELVKLADIGSNYKVDKAGDRRQGQNGRRVGGKHAVLMFYAQFGRAGDEATKAKKHGNADQPHFGANKITVFVIIIVLLFLFAEAREAAHSIGKGKNSKNDGLDAGWYWVMGIGGVALIAIVAYLTFLAIRCCVRCCCTANTKGQANEAAEAEEGLGLTFWEELRRAVSKRRKKMDETTV